MTRRGWLSRIGCGAALLVWSVVLLIPLFLFVLAVQGEIALWRGGDVPEPEGHPLLQVKLLMEIETRGLNITSTSVSHWEDNRACMQTDVRYLLWEGRGENVQYCECYTRETTEGDWDFAASLQGACTADFIETAAVE